MFSQKGILAISTTMAAAALAIAISTAAYVASQPEWPASPKSRESGWILPRRSQPSLVMRNRLWNENKISS